MSFSVALIAAVATVNPLRLWTGLPGTGRRDRVLLVGLGAGLVVVVLAVVAAVSGPLLDALDISDPTARIAAGVALVVVGVRDVFSGPADVEPALTGRGAAVVPVAVPHLFTPGLTLLVLSAAADRGFAVALSVVVIAVGSVVALASLPAPRGAGTRAGRAGHVLTAGLALALGVALMLDGVLDI